MTVPAVHTGRDDAREVGRRRPRRPRGVLRSLAMLCLWTCAPTTEHEPVPSPAPRRSFEASAAVTAAGASVHAAIDRTTPSDRDDAHGRTPPPAAHDTADSADAAPEGPLEMTFVGDVILGRYRGEHYDPIPDGEHEVFGEIAPLLRSDLVVGNLETPLVRALPDDGSPIISRYRFGADATLAAHLQQGGFDALSLANNHAYDMRGSGIEQTPKILGELGIVALGTARADGSPVRVETIERAGRRIAFVAVTTRSNIPGLKGVAPIPLVAVPDLETEVAPVVAQGRLDHDLVVVLVHWGQEYADAPTPAQQQAAHALVESGADLVIGHHPHVLQGFERYGHGIIAYSLGNFLFENVHEVPRQTGVLRVRYDVQGCLEAVRFHPAFVKSIPIKHPVPARGHMGDKVKERVRDLSRPFGTEWMERGDALAMIGPGCASSDAAQTPTTTPSE